MARRGSRGGRRNGGHQGQKGSQGQKARNGGGRVQVIEERGDDMTLRGEEARKAIAAWSGFDGANRSQRRSMIYMPTLDTQRELDSYSRTELLRKARWMQNNMGFAKRVVHGLADLCGYLQPQWQTSDKEWNRAAEKLWRDRSGESAVSDMAGQFCLPEMQIHLNRYAFGDGDVLPVIVKGSTGGAMISLYEAPQLQTPKGQEKNKRWVDGVRINKFGRKVAFGLRDSGAKAVKTVGANDALYFAHADKSRRVRPPSILAGAINHLLDTADILADTKLAIKVAAQFGIYRRAQGQNMTPGKAIATGLRNEQLDPGGTEKSDAGADIDARVRELKVEDIYRSLGGVAALAGGEELGTVQDTRPHPNQIELLKWLVRDCSWYAGVSPEFIWDITGLGGAGVRLMNADLERWLVCRQLSQALWLRKYCAVWTACEMGADRLGEPEAGEFWNVGFIPQASLTADKGREGKLDLALVQNRLMSRRTYFGRLGQDWETEMEQIDREERWMGEHGMDPGAGLAARSVDLEGRAEDEDHKKKESK